MRLVEFGVPPSKLSFDEGEVVSESSRTGPASTSLSKTPFVIFTESTYSTQTHVPAGREPTSRPADEATVTRAEESGSNVFTRDTHAGSVLFTVMFLCFAIIHGSGMPE